MFLNYGRSTVELCRKSLNTQIIDILILLSFCLLAVQTHSITVTAIERITNIAFFYNMFFKNAM